MFIWLGGWWGINHWYWIRLDLLNLAWKLCWTISWSFYLSSLRALSKSVSNWLSFISWLNFIWFVAKLFLSCLHLEISLSIWILWTWDNKRTALLEILMIDGRCGNEFIWARWSKVLHWLKLIDFLFRVQRLLALEHVLRILYLSALRHANNHIWLQLSFHLVLWLGESQDKWNVLLNLVWA